MSEGSTRLCHSIPNAHEIYTCVHMPANFRMGQKRTRRRVWEQGCNLARRNHPLDVSLKREKTNVEYRVLACCIRCDTPSSTGVYGLGWKGLWFVAWGLGLGIGGRRVTIRQHSLFQCLQSVFAARFRALSRDKK